MRGYKLLWLEGAKASEKQTMKMISNSTKILAVAGIAGAAALLGSVSTASARTFTRCDGDHCVRVHCDWNGDNCWREASYYRSDYHDYDRDRGYYGGYYGGYGDYSAHRRWVCDTDGDDCHWQYW